MSNWGALQANLMFSIQLCELASPVLLPKVVDAIGMKAAAQLHHLLSMLNNLNLAFTSNITTMYMTPLFR